MKKGRDLWWHSQMAAKDISDEFIPPTQLDPKAIIKENKSPSTTKLGEDSKPREGLPDEIMN